jgi:sugar/nucleoside kinase (ribokinase family)
MVFARPRRPSVGAAAPDAIPRLVRPIACPDVPDAGRDAPSPRYQVVGIGNALVDVIAHVGDDFLDKFELVKGSMSLIETERAVELYRALEVAVEMSGGSAANTMCGVASLGGRAAYIGKVSADDLGTVFGHDLHAVGVAFRPGAPSPATPTGRCIIVVTPDAQRTMNTYLGVSSELHSDDLDLETIADGQVLYMEGYLFDRDDAKAAFRRAAEVAHAHGRKVSLTLSDSFCVDRHRRDFRTLVAEQVDVLFGNDDELRSLYEVDDLGAAIAAVRSECALAAITVGPAGSLVITEDDVIEVPAVAVDRVLDTTGAGDLYAAGFLFGLTSGADLRRCAELGSIAAAEVISHVGPRPLVPLVSLV